MNVAALLALILTAAVPGAGPAPDLAALAETALPSGALLAGRGSIPRPQRVRGRLPRYPLNAERDEITGQVGLLLQIRVDGRVGEARVLASTTKEQGFEAAAVRAAERWLYTPVLHRGAPVEVWLPVEVIFTADAYRLEERRSAMAANLGRVADAQFIEPGDHVAGRAGVDYPAGLKTPAPDYPRPARLRQLESRVLLLVRVDASGRVSEMPLTWAELPGEGFGEAAERTVRGWRFHPVRVDGEPVPVWHWISVDFALKTD